MSTGCRLCPCATTSPLPSPTRHSLATALSPRPHPSSLSLSLSPSLPSLCSSLSCQAITALEVPLKALHSQLKGAREVRTRQREDLGNYDAARQELSDLSREAARLRDLSAAATGKHKRLADAARDTAALASKLVRREAIAERAAKDVAAIPARLIPDFIISSEDERSARAHASARDRAAADVKRRIALQARAEKDKIAAARESQERLDAWFALSRADQDNKVIRGQYEEERARLLPPLVVRARKLVELCSDMKTDDVVEDRTSWCFRHPCTPLSPFSHCSPRAAATSLLARGPRCVRPPRRGGG